MISPILEKKPSQAILAEDQGDEKHWPLTTANSVTNILEMVKTQRDAI